MKRFDWSAEKNAILKAQRGISFEEIVFHVARGEVLDILTHPDARRYGGQMIFVLRINNYCWLAPFVEDDERVFLKTAIPSRKATAAYLREGSDQ